MSRPHVGRLRAGAYAALVVVSIFRQLISVVSGLLQLLLVVAPARSRGVDRSW